MNIKDSLHAALNRAGLTDARRRVAALALAGVLVGLLTMFVGGWSGHPKRVWQAYLVNYLFWSSLAFGGVGFAAMLDITGSRWGRPFKRLAEAFGAYLPVSFILFWPIYLGREHLFPWIAHPAPHKAAWLSVNFLFFREGVGLLLLTAAALALVYGSVKSDRASVSGGAGASEKSQRRRTTLPVAYAVLYFFVLTLMALDLIMSLDPHWISTLFGAYFAIGGFYAALAALAVLAGAAHRYGGLAAHVGPRHFHDLGKLLFGLLLLTGDFAFSQVLVIWYGNIGSETGFLIARFKLAPWVWVSYMVLLIAFILPFLILLSRKIKTMHGPLMVIGGFILAGMWLERFLLIAPSIWPAQSLPLGFAELFVTAGFLGLMTLSVMYFLKRCPIVPVSDPLFIRGTAERDAEEGLQP